MTLCSICYQLDLRNLTDTDNDLQDVSHHTSLPSLKQSALSCPLCKLFLTQLFLDKAAIFPSGPDLDRSPIVLRGYQYVDDEGDQGGIWRLKVRCDKARARAFFGLYPDEECAPVVPREIIIGSAIKPPEERFDLLKNWIQQCDEQHSHCSEDTCRLPTRVIDVGVDGVKEPSVKVTNGEIGQYMTLSHCWGTKPMFKTTKETLPQHLVELPMDALPKTFRDAITITRKLGIRYLWIDSLCICQDCPDDWERESAVMGQIYSLSYLTIAAASSKDSSGGCFLPRTTNSHVRVKCSINDSQIGHVFIREKPDDFGDLGHSHLNTRAWVAQERLLSPRTIHYDVDQILWECREARHAEDSVPVDAFSTQHLAWDGRLHLEYPYSKNGAGTAHFVWDWYQFVEDYSKRALTQTTDKLPALSGLATVMESRTGDKYAAGLWASNLHVGILWKRVGPWLGQPTKYRAPSWSWAAWDGPIIMPEDADINTTLNPHHCMAEVVGVHTTPQGLDPNGKLSSGFLTVTARLKIADPRIDPQSDSYERYPEQGAGDDHIRDKGESVGVVNFDLPYETPGGPLYCLQMTRKRLVRRDLCYVLFLEPTGKEDEFKRIGLGRTGGGNLREGWFEDAPKRTVRII